MEPEIMEGVLKHIHPVGGLERAKIVEIAPGYIKLSVEVTPAALNLYGNAHGGFLYTLCDSASGMSTYTYGVTNVTQCASINYLKGVQSGTLFVESKALHKGRKTVVNQVTIHDGQDRLVVTGTFTMFLGEPVIPLSAPHPEANSVPTDPPAPKKSR